MSGCAKLDTLWCYTNQLTELDVTKCPQLTSLSCPQNSLTKLDVTKCRQLTILLTHRNQISELDVSECTQLKSLGCNDNLLTKLDVSNCPSLYELSCQRNQIKELKPAKNGDLTELYCHMNELNGKAMDDLIGSLPTQENAFICVVNTDQGDNEHNICTKEHVTAANAKGWTAYQWINNDWAVYEGSDPSAISVVPADKDNRTAPVYDLRGHRINGPQKGIMIQGGKKILVR